MHLKSSKSWLINLLTGFLFIIVMGWLGVISAYAIERLYSNKQHHPNYLNTPLTIQTEKGISKYRTQITLWGQHSETEASNKSTLLQKKNNDDLKVTPLPLKLLGTQITGKMSLAIIQSGNQSNIYQKNAIIRQGVTLIEIYKDYVVINNRGKTEVLTFDNVDITSILNKKQTDPLLQQQLENEQALLALSHQLRENPFILKDYVQYRALEEEGVWKGLVVAPKENSSVFYHLGFKDNDIITGVNGMTADEIAKDDSLWRTFLSTKSFDLQIEREGESTTLFIDLNHTFD